MPTKAERTALVFLSTVVLVGGAVRVARAVRGGLQPGALAATALAAQRRLADAAGHPRPAGSAPRAPHVARADTPGAKESRALRTAKAPSPFPIDIDRATAREIEALPRIGPALAARVVAEREAHGPFGGLEALDKRVRGIGPAMAKALEPFVTFSGR